ncbi:MAG: Xylose isomerase-like TIM barrel [Firmicutes bacterium ADurb.Bin193]|nr:MAG: Xylose isomerase-like TIM barrel [Firmicutes bacterium ADurb.Bin193]
MARFILSAFADEIHESLDIQIDNLKKHGIKYIEFRSLEGKNVCDHTIEEIKRIKTELDKNGIKVSAIGSPIGKIKITDDFAPELKRFSHIIEIAKIMEAKYIRMFSFYIEEGQNPDDFRDEVIKRWQEYIRLAEGKGVILLHENEKGIYGDTSERCLDLLKTLDCDYVKSVFDPANFVQCEATVYPEAFEILAEYSVYFHIKDALAGDGRNVPAGMGDGKIGEILSALKSRGYEGFLSLEPHLGNFKGFAGLELDSQKLGEQEAGPETFDIAVSALKKLLEKIGCTVQ